MEAELLVLLGVVARAATEQLASAHKRGMHVRQHPSPLGGEDETDGAHKAFPRRDFFSERALDKFGFIPPDDLHAIVYFAYGDRGEQPPELEEIPAP